jgi:release factor glutamine methyltransferase
VHTIRELYDNARGRLVERGSANSDAEELLSRLLGVSRGELRRRLDTPADPEIAARCDEWVRRRVAGEPVQYITGRAAFRDLDLTVNPSVLVPRPETEGLVECVLTLLLERSADWPAPRVLDLGTGSGAIALAIASEHPSARVTATDSSVAALDLARANARDLGLHGRVAFAEGEWFDAIGGDDMFEVIVSNPPYIARAELSALPEDVREHEPHAALFSGESGLDAITEIVKSAPDHLVAGGVLALELAEERAHQVGAWFEGADAWSDAEVLDDLSGRPRVLRVQRRMGPAIAPRQWPEDP